MIYVYVHAWVRTDVRRMIDEWEGGADGVIRRVAGTCRVGGDVRTWARAR